MKGRLTILFLLFIYVLPAQQVVKVIQKGNDFYKQQQYDQAAINYDQALTMDSTNKIAKFNKAATLYRQAKPDEAIKAFDDLAFRSEAPADKARSYYNEGVVLSNQKKLEESIDAYKNALRQDPNDKDARENLQKALLELKKRTPPPPKKEDKKKQQQNKKQQQQPKMNPKEAEQSLKLLEQKEKELQQRMQQQKSKSTTGGKRDW